MPRVPGMVKGLGVTLKTAIDTMFPNEGAKKLVPAPNKGSAVPYDPDKGTLKVGYPHVREEIAPRFRGVITLNEDNCTACMLCARECPDWCIYIEAHKTLAPPRRAGGKPRQVNELDRFDIDFSLCMYCGICVEVCPFEALYWSPEYEYSELRIQDLLHTKQRLGEWFETVPEFEPYEAGAEVKAKKVSRKEAK